MIRIPDFIEDSHKLSKACLFAAIAHGGQQRKYTFEPYIHHPIEVCEILHKSHIRDTNMLQAALLHDVIEDTEATFGQVKNEFGYDVAMLVKCLSKASIIDDYEGNRAERHHYDIARMAECSYQVHTIKCADIMHNTPSIAEHGEDFSQVWLLEKKDYLEVMDKANDYLWAETSSIILRSIAAL